MPEVEPTVQRSRAATGSGRNGQGYMGERKCADTIGTVLVPWAGHFQY